MENLLRARVRELLIVERWSRLLVRYSTYVIEWHVGVTITVEEVPTIDTSRLNPWYALRLTGPPSEAF